MASRGSSDHSLDVPPPLEVGVDNECGSSSDSEHEEEAQAPRRRLSVASFRVPSQTILMQDYLLKYTSALTGWKRRMFTLTPSALFYSKTADSQINVETRIAGASVAERRDKDLVFELNTSEKKLQLQAPTRAKMEQWIAALRRAVSEQKGLGPASCEHNWRFASAKKQYVCAACERRCSSTSTSTLVCEVCRLPAHKLCAPRIVQSCKWSTLESVPVTSRLGTGDLGHQWVRGNVLPGRCAVCSKAVGGSKRLEDLHCLWCRESVHDSCLAGAPMVCTLGELRMSIVSPAFVVPASATDPSLVISAPPSRTPLLVFVNSKSGNNDGLRILRLCRRMLNPSQVIDLTTAGPAVGLGMVRNCESARVLVCGGDGTVAWVLREVDAAGLSQCRVGVMPLGTGNDLSRVLGWSGGVTLERDTLGDYLQCVEHARESTLDRWSVSVSALPPEESGAEGGEQAGTFHRSRFAVSADGKSVVVMASHRRNPLAEDADDPPEVPSPTSTPTTHPTSSFASAEPSPGSPKTRSMASPAASPPMPRARGGADSSGPSRRSSGSAPRADSMVERYMAQYDKCASEVERALASGDSICEPSQALVAALNSLMRYSGEEAKEMARFTALREDLLSVAKATVTADERVRVFSCLARMAEMAAHLAEACVPMESGREVCVMNNYLGLGLDAKIALDFNTLREQHPEKCKSRIKNQMWYGVLGGKEMMQQTCRNLQRQLVLECDGRVVELPRLQGIVILNIASYMGGTNFWGGRAEKAFRAPSHNDGLLEVVAVSGTAQMAACKTLPGVSPTRLAQAREVRITIRAGAGVPMQVDGEAWLQAPCVVTISHKNRIRVLCRDKELHQRLQAWQPRRDSNSEYGMDLVFQLQLSVDELYMKLSESQHVGDKEIALFTAITAAREHLAEGKDPQPYFTACAQLLSHLSDTAATGAFGADLTVSQSRCASALHDAITRAPPSRHNSAPSQYEGSDGSADSPPMAARTGSSLRLVGSPKAASSRNSPALPLDEAEEMAPE